MAIGEGKGIRSCGSRGARGSVAVLPMNSAVLPMNIIEKEILCRLPVKPLLRCKSVCKLWYSVINSPKFTSSHYHHRSNRYRPIFLERFDDFDMPSDQVLPILNPGAPESLPMPFNLEDNDGEGVGANLLSSSYSVGLPWEAIFVRPVNGFLLLLLPNRFADRCRMAMFNPATRQFLDLSDFKFNTPWGPPQNPPYPTWDHMFGFGICSRHTTDSNPNPTPHVYKVVWLHVRTEQRDVAVGKVFTICNGGDRDSPWRMIDADLPSRFVKSYCNYPEYNISMNGRCYWLSINFAHILVFDLDEEVFREMDSPIPSNYHCRERTHNKKAWHAMFSEVPCYGDEGGNSLALFVFGSITVDISVMDKKEEWHWIRRIVTYIRRPISDLSNPSLQFQLPFPMTDTIVFKSEISSFAFYHPKTDGCVNFRRISCRCPYSYISVLNFRESLFSVEGGIQVSDRLLKDFNIYLFET